MQLLTDKYRPSSIAGFIGLDKPKTICNKLAAKPFASAWRFVGPTGVGKTSLALALAAQMPAELHHIPSQDCNLDNLRRVIGNCHYVPKSGCKMHLVLIDEADQMTAAAQLYLLSKLDGTAFPPNTIFIFTMNSTDGLEKRFLDRTVEVWFSSKGIAPETTSFLELVWQCEAEETAIAPNFARIVKEANNSVRGALAQLQHELMCL
jgi:hypothetical protein